MDIKIQGITAEILTFKPLPKSQARFEILDVIEATIPDSPNWLQLPELIPSRSMWTRSKIVISKGGKRLLRLSLQRQALRLISMKKEMFLYSSDQML